MDAAARMTGSDGGCNDIVGVADVDTVVHPCSNSLLDDDEKEYDKPLTYTYTLFIPRVPIFRNQGNQVRSVDQSIATTSETKNRRRRTHDQSVYIGE